MPNFKTKDFLKLCKKNYLKKIIITCYKKSNINHVLSLIICFIKVFLYLIIFYFFFFDDFIS